MRPASLSSTRVTSAAFAAGSVSEPAKITSLIDPARRTPGLCSPSAKSTASVTLLLPDPFGPTIAVIPPSSGIRTGRAKVLNPLIYIAESTKRVFYATPPHKARGKVQQMRLQVASFGGFQVLAFRCEATGARPDPVRTVRMV